MTLAQLEKLALPDAPGVYTFRDDKDRPLYIGRATVLKDRVRSYFRADVIESRGPRIVDMVTKARTITWQETGSVLEAILLESELIKKYQPYYNVDERDDKSAQYVIITGEPWPRVFLARARDFDQMVKDECLPYDVLHRFGPFTEAGLIKEAMKILRKLFPFRDKKAIDPKHEQFYRMLGQSPDRTGADGHEDSAAHAAYLKTIDHLTLFFKGRKSRLLADLTRDMKAAAKELRFEDADRAKRLIYALSHINDMSLIKRETSARFGAVGGAHGRAFRIEAYDVAHLGGMENVGVMVVSMNGQFDTNEYRKFKISRNTNDDIAGLTEILSRRLNHSEWQYPDLIAVDGNEVHMRHAERVLQARRISIPVVAVTKDERHKASHIVGTPELARRYKQEIIALNAEAHRFAIRYHRHRREGMGSLRDIQ